MRVKARMLCVGAANDEREYEECEREKEKGLQR